MAKERMGNAIFQSIERRSLVLLFVTIATCQEEKEKIEVINLGIGRLEDA